MKSSNKNKTTKLKLILNITIVTMMIVVFVLLGSFLYRVFFSESIVSSVFDRNNIIEQDDRIQISILNGCGVDGLASKAKEYMFGKNFDVVTVGNFDSTAERSFVIDWIGDRDAAESSAAEFGINDSLIVTHIDSNRYLMNTIVIGKDYKKLDPFN